MEIWQGYVDAVAGDLFYLQTYMENYPTGSVSLTKVWKSPNWQWLLPKMQTRNWSVT